MSFELTLDEHPAIADNPITGEKLKDADGEPVRLLPKWKSIRMSGAMIGYVAPGNRITLLRPVEQLTQAVVDAIEELVKNQLGEVQQTQVVPPVNEDVEDEDEDE